MDNIDQFGIPASIVKSKIEGKLIGSSVITVICACGMEQSLKVASVVRTIRRVGFYRCISCGMKAKHQEPEYQRIHRNGVIEAWSEDRRKNRSNISKQQWLDPTFRTAVTNASKRAWQDAGKCLEASKRTKKLWGDPSYLSKQMVKNLNKR